MSGPLLSARYQQPKRKTKLHTPQLWLQPNSAGPYNYIDKVIKGTLFGYYALGLYQLGFQFFMFIRTLPVSLYQYLLP